MYYPSAIMIVGLLLSLSVGLITFGFTRECNKLSGQSKWLRERLERAGELLVEARQLAIEREAKIEELKAACKAQRDEMSEKAYRLSEKYEVEIKALKLELQASRNSYGKLTERWKEAEIRHERIGVIFQEAQHKRDDRLFYRLSELHKESQLIAIRGRMIEEHLLEINSELLRPDTTRRDDPEAGSPEGNG